MTRRDLARQAGAVIGNSWARIRAEPKRPNIVFILIDDLRYDDLRISGPSWIKSPNIDRIAREGVWFENAFVTAPLCSPSRGCFLTGQYAHAHGILDNTERGSRSHQLLTLPRLLHERGYETGFIGKWHMGADDTPRPGFDYWLSMKGLGTYFDPHLNENGNRRQVRGYLTDIFNLHAVDFIRKKRDRPFCLWLAHQAVNPEVSFNADGTLNLEAQVFPPAERHQHLYDGAHIPRRPNYLRPPLDKPALERDIQGVPRLGPNSGTLDSVIRNRLRELASVDDGIGDMLDALKHSGQLDNTLFAVVSDHGYFYGEHCLSDERRLAYEESIHVPFLIRYPPLIRPGQREARFALGIDVAPTMLDVAGEPVPAWMHGKSLLPLLANRARGWRQAFLVEYFSDTTMPRVNHMGYQAVRTQRWKYIHYTELKNMDEVYDLSADPYEMRNLADDPGANHVKKELRTELKRLLTASAGASYSYVRVGQEDGK